MGYLSFSTATQGCVHIHDTNGNSTDVPPDRVRELLDRCIEALGQAPGCQCGDRRVTITEHENDETFYPRTGCATCNTWDSEPRMKKS
jgi:hypothetical protein